MSRVLPILFNTEMVRAILNGRKTVTRRIIKPQPQKDQSYKIGVCIYGNKKDVGKTVFGTNKQGGRMLYVRPPYLVGDILYVRETWCNANKEGMEPDYYYFADTFICEDYDSDEWTWRPSIHMPKEAARIWLKITGIRVERLQDIDDDGAKAEGSNWKNGKNVGWEEKMQRTAVERFAEIWDKTIKKPDQDTYGWVANPWVWVIEFERCEKPDENKCQR